MLALPVFEGLKGGWGAEGKPPADIDALPNASKLAKSAFAFCVAGGSDRMRFRQTDRQTDEQKKSTMRGKHWMG